MGLVIRGDRETPDPLAFREKDRPCSMKAGPLAANPAQGKLNHIGWAIRQAFTASRVLTTC
jgi:hypothetical protein